MPYNVGSILYLVNALGDSSFVSVDCFSFFNINIYAFKKMSQLCLFKCQKDVNMSKRSILLDNIYIFNRLLYEKVDQWGNDDVKNCKLYENVDPISII